MATAVNPEVWRVTVEETDVFKILLSDGWHVAYDFQIVTGGFTYKGGRQGGASWASRGVHAVWRDVRREGSFWLCCPIGSIKAVTTLAIKLEEGDGNRSGR